MIPEVVNISEAKVHDRYGLGHYHPKVFQHLLKMALYPSKYVRKNKINRKISLFQKQFLFA